jgi:hypothetical protein
MEPTVTITEIGKNEQDDKALEFADRVKVYGTIHFDTFVTLGNNNYQWNDVWIDAIDKQTGEYMGSFSLASEYWEQTGTDFDYAIELPREGNYILRVGKSVNNEYASYYINLGADHVVGGTDADADKFVPENRVDWVEAEVAGNGGYRQWLPNPQKAGWAQLYGDDKAQNVNIDFAQIDAGLITIEGTIKVASSFILGEECEVGGETKYNQECWNSYNSTWKAYRSLRVEAINKVTGDWLGSVEITGDGTDNDDGTTSYSGKFKLGESISTELDKFILRVTRQSNSANKWKYDEIYYHFGADHAIDGDTDKLVNGKTINWVEAEGDSENGYAWKNWIPDPAQTGWLETSTAVTGLMVDLSTFGQNDYKISGQVTLPNDVNLTSNNDYAYVEVINAQTGNWMGSVPVENDGSYEVTIGENPGRYILRTSLSHWDPNDYDNSFWRSYYVDFGDNFIVDNNVTEQSAPDKLVKEHKVQWVEVDVAGQDWNNWVPNVNGLDVGVEDENVKVYTVNIDYTDPVLPKVISGTISGVPSDAQWANIMLVDPNSYFNLYDELRYSSDSNWTYRFDDAEDGNYTLEVMYQSSNGEYFHYFAKEDGEGGYTAVDGSDVDWQHLGGYSWGPNPEQVAYIAINATTELNVTIPVDGTNRVNVGYTISSIDASTQNVYAEMFIPEKPFYHWINCNDNEAACSVTGGDTTVVFNDIKKKANVYTRFWIDGKEYYYDASSVTTPKTLNPDVYWAAFDGDNNQVCPDGNGEWNCDWDNSSDWNWRPTIDGEDLSVLGADENRSVQLPAMAKVQAVFSLGAEVANEYVYINLWQHNGNDYYWKELKADGNGDVNVSLNVNPGSNYRFEAWTPVLYDGFVVDKGTNEAIGGGDDGLILGANSWKSDGTWGPVVNTLLNITGNVDFGILTPPTLNKITFTIQNRNVEEDIWISVENNSSIFGNSNVVWNGTTDEFTNTVTVKVPNGDYHFIAFPSDHKHGLLSDQDGNLDLETFDWEWDSAVSYSVTGDVNYTVTLPSSANLHTISGQVTGFDDNSGWIEAYSKTTKSGQGAEVNATGHFSITGLEPAADYKVRYYVYTTGEKLQQEPVDVSTADVTDIALVKVDTIYDLNGTISGSATEAMLVLVDLGENGTLDSTDSWDIIDTQELVSGNFAFIDLSAPPTNNQYGIAAYTVDTSRGYTRYLIRSLVFDDVGGAGADTAVTIDGIKIDGEISISLTEGTR